MEPHLQSLYKLLDRIFLFIPLACFIRPQNYPGNLTEFICNFIALDCSYNREWWFFLPYVLLVISSKHIFNILDKLDLKTTLTTVTVLCILYIITNTIGKSIFRTSQPLQVVAWYITLLFTKNGFSILGPNIILSMQRVDRPQINRKFLFGEEYREK